MRVKADILAAIPEEDEDKRKLAYRAFERLRERIFRDDMLVRRRRPDGRAFDQIRQITCEVGVLPRVHGSALFTRGETQALATTTLGTKEDKQRLDLLFEEESFKRFMLHYNFPPFSVGEVKFLRGPGRREIGHGALAERALGEPASAGSGFPVRDARGVGHSGIERIVVDGDGLRRLARVDGRGRAAEGSAAPESRWDWWSRATSTPSSPTSPAPKITTATWISKLPARGRELRRCRWTSRSAA